MVCNRGKTNGGKPERLPGVSDAEYQQMLQAELRLNINLLTKTLRHTRAVTGVHTALDHMHMSVNNCQQLYHFMSSEALEVYGRV